MILNLFFKKILEEAHDGPGLKWVERETIDKIPAEAAINARDWVCGVEPLFIGRAIFNSKLIPGKISGFINYYKPDFNCIFVPFRGLEHKIASKHEILVKNI